MLELQHISRDRYQRNGGGGCHPDKIYNTSKAYFDAIGHNDKPVWERTLIETKFRWRQTCETAKEHFRIACLTSKEGFYHGEDIPF